MQNNWLVFFKMSRFLKDNGQLRLEKTRDVTGKGNTWYYIKSYWGQDKICLAKRMLLGQLAKSELKLWLPSFHTDSTLADMGPFLKPAGLSAVSGTSTRPQRDTVQEAQGVSILQGKKSYDRKQSGCGGQT